MHTRARVQSERRRWLGGAPNRRRNSALNDPRLSNLTSAQTSVTEESPESSRNVNRANFSIPVRILEAPSFGASVATTTAAIPDFGMLISNMHNLSQP